MKRDLTDGGICVPLITWWPGAIQSGHVSYFGDLMATACDLAGIDTPPNTDSISFLPTLLGQFDRQQEHEYLYWEFYEGASSQAVRWGNWKAVRTPMLRGRIEIYDIVRDSAERYNLARRGDLVEQARKFMAEAHVAHPSWQAPKPK